MSIRDILASMATLGKAAPAAETRRQLPAPTITPAPGGKPHIQITGDKGEAMHLDVSKPGIAQIYRADVPEDLQNQGRGINLYDTAINYALANGRRLVSDNYVSRSARNVYEGLSRRGYDVVQHPEAFEKEDGGLSTRVGGKYKGPVFEIRGRKAQAAPGGAPAMAPDTDPDIPQTLANAATLPPRNPRMTKP